MGIIVPHAVRLRAGPGYRRIVQEIEAGRGAEAQRLYRTHLSAAQAVVLDQTDDGIVSAAAAGARLALQSVTRARI